MLDCNKQFTINSIKRARDLILSRSIIAGTSHGHSRLIIVRLSITPDRNRNFVPEEGQDSAEK